MKFLKLLNLFNLFKPFKLFKLFSLLPTACCLLPVFLLVGCAIQERKMPDTSQLQWPLPPDEARVKYVRWWTGAGDFKKGFIEQIAGEEATGLSFPRSVTTDKLGNIYVVDFQLGIAVFDLQAEKFRIVETSGAIMLKRPSDIRVDDNGNLWVSDIPQSRVIVYNKDGKYLRAIGGESELKIPIRLTMDKERGRLYVLDRDNHTVRVYDLSGNFLFGIGSPKKVGSDEGYFFGPQGIALDRDGNIYVADTFNFRVQSFTPDGKFRFKFGKAGDAHGSFGRPVGVAVDSEGNIYVADILFNNVQVFDKGGKYIFTIGELGWNAGQFSFPSGIYIDENDRIYVCDQMNHAIQVFQYLSERYKKEQQAAGGKQ